MKAKRKTEIVESPDPKLAVLNPYKVPLKQWRRWNVEARMIFNYTHALMMGAQEMFVHPKAPMIKKDHWQTIAWNAAWIAADARLKIEQEGKTMAKKPMPKKFAEGGAVTKHQSLATGGSAPEASRSPPSAGFKKGGKVKSGRKC